MNTTENLIATGCPAIAPQPENKIVKPLKFPAQPQEWKIVSLRKCRTPDTMQQCETPDQAAAYWRAHIANHPYFNPECECLVVFILNTRRRIKGHYLVSIGTMDTILCHPREVFRLAVMASAAAIIIAHNLCAAAVYVQLPVVGSNTDAGCRGRGALCLTAEHFSNLTRILVQG